jgi:undecaprenyl-diphosphatase
LQLLLVLVCIFESQIAPMDTLFSIDQQLFHFINDTLSNAFLDWLMPFWRDKKFWIPFYILGLIAIGKKFKTSTIYWVLFVALTVTLSDTLSSKIMKPTFERIRPCNTEQMIQEVRILVPCGKGYSFTSSHATNHFAVAVFVLFTLGYYFKKIGPFMLVWAATISLGQVYVGAHYPMDILIGGLLGSGIGYLVFLVYKRLPNYQLKESGI